MYKNYLESHMKMHTGIGLIPCLHCDKTFTTNTTMCAHANIHLNEVHICQTCGKSFCTEACLKQPATGKHGTEFIPACGEQFQWPKKCTIMRHIVVIVLK